MTYQACLVEHLLPRIVASAALVVLPGFSESQPAGARHEITAFVDVNVVPMDVDLTLSHRTVVVRDGKIEKIGSKSSVKIPDGARIIRCKGCYLMPGLTDMHAHFLRAPVPGKKNFKFPDYAEKNEMFALLDVANGVTANRNMWGTSEIDVLRQRILDGSVLGPTIYSTGPVTDGDPPTWDTSRVVVTQEQAQHAVQDDKAKGYVGIKVYDHLSNEAYKYIVAAAARERLAVVGHIPFAVSLQEVIDAPQASIEHMDSFVGDLNPAPTQTKGKTLGQLWSEVDVNKLPSFAAQMKSAGVWVCPTIVVYQMDWPRQHVAEEMKYIPAEFAGRFLQSSYGDSETPNDSELEIRKSIELVRILHAAGVGLLAGTDRFKPNVVPGFSLHEELQYFVQAGLTPYEAIKAATSDAARFLHLEEEFGTVVVGRRADLLLLHADPLQDVRNAANRVGVMLRGRWIPEAELQERLKKLAR